MKTAIIVFPGTNCDIDTKRALEHLGHECSYVFHNEEQSFNNYDLIILPGGFSYGDYIRAGRLAKFSPVIGAIKNYIEAQRGFVLGICNGFQILCETGILPGALIYNKNLKFSCKDIKINFNNETLTLPIANKEGCYYIPESQKHELNEYKIISYLDDINGSYDKIAGLYHSKKRIMGLMPHPERAVFEQNGLKDGKFIFDFIESELKCPL